MKHVVLALLALALVAVFVIACTPAPAPTPLPPTAAPAQPTAAPKPTEAPKATSVPAAPAAAGGRLALIKSRGKIICGVNDALPGFSALDKATGQFAGFDADYCRAVAAAVLGDAKAIEFRPVNTGQRARIVGCPNRPITPMLCSSSLGSCGSLLRPHYTPIRARVVSPILAERGR